ncbi:MAG: TetR-like C-terminal domain-containing protein [Bacilli bacterium]
MVPRSEFTKKCLVEALLKMIRRGKTFEEISIQEIVDEAGFSRMAYYRNFKEKAEILRYYFDLITNQFNKATNTNFYVMSFEQYLVSVFTHLFNHRELSLILLKTKMFDYVREQLDLKLIKTPETPEQKQHFIFFAGGVFNMYKYWLETDGKETPEEMAHIVANYIPRP